jgi:membrane protein implicated in regulation of membrane protease activity
MMWWGWMVLAAVLLSVELFAVDAQFYLVFLGVSAALVGLAGLLGLDLPSWGQWALFAVLALVSFVTFRRSLYSKLRAGAPGLRESLAGEVVTVRDGLAAGAEGRIEFRGTQWAARNVGVEAIPAGHRAQVVDVDGVTLNIKGE